MASPVTVVVINKDEPDLDATLEALARHHASVDFDVAVVDASAGRLDWIRDKHPQVAWHPFEPVPGRGISIAHQRNFGVEVTDAPIIAFTDAGCIPVEGWLDRLVEPIVSGEEQVTVGMTEWSSAGAHYMPRLLSAVGRYADEAPTINLAFTRAAFTEVGGFDEAFDYGSDVDFTWRLRQSGHLLRRVPEAKIHAFAGGSRRALKRGFRYGSARARLYHKHAAERRHVLRRDPVIVVYPLFVLGLPLTLLRRFRWYPLLLLVPAWRARRHRPALTIADHLAYAVGALHYLLEVVAERRRSGA